MTFRRFLREWGPINSSVFTSPGRSSDFDGTGWPGNTREREYSKGSEPPWDGITAYQHRANYERAEEDPLFRATWLEEEVGKETTGVPLIGTHMSRDLISRYLRPYLVPPMLRPSSTLDLEHAADNVIERNADRIGWRE